MTFDNPTITLTDEERDAISFYCVGASMKGARPELVVEVRAQSEASRFVKRCVRIYREHREAITASLKEL